MPVLYHGTSRAFATAMAGTPVAGGTIDVTRGRGEFGRGFYTQASSGNAARRGQTLYGNNSAVLILIIDHHEYHALHLRRLTLNMAQKLNAQLRAHNTQHTYTTVHDAIVGPLVRQVRIEQQKFQTAKAQTLLNGPLTQLTVK
ncbi:MAG TPA: hypothetical protein VG013_25375 [Gemmataceae bacterium]|jgi:hypothetical protein|nr:hypothetical protein [Gemmataceae bacterium]